jgi:hypothetical protein
LRYINLFHCNVKDYNQEAQVGFKKIEVFQSFRSDLI